MEKFEKPEQQTSEAKRRENQRVIIIVKISRQFVNIIAKAKLNSTHFSALCHLASEVPALRSLG